MLKRASSAVESVWNVVFQLPVSARKRWEPSLIVHAMPQVPSVLDTKVSFWAMELPGATITPRSLSALKANTNPLECFT